MEQSQFPRSAKVRRLQSLKICIHRATSDYDNDVIPRQELFFMNPVNFPHTTTHAVAHHGFAEFLPDGHTDPIFTQAVGAGLKYQIFCDRGLAPVIQFAKYVIQFQ